MTSDTKCSNNNQHLHEAVGLAQGCIASMQTHTELHCIVLQCNIAQLYCPKPPPSCATKSLPRWGWGLNLSSSERGERRRFYRAAGRRRAKLVQTLAGRVVAWQRNALFAGPCRLDRAAAGRPGWSPASWRTGAHKVWRHQAGCQSTGGVSS